MYDNLRRRKENRMGVGVSYILRGLSSNKESEELSASSGDRRTDPSPEDPWELLCDVTRLCRLAFSLPGNVQHAKFRLPCMKLLSVTFFFLWENKTGDGCILKNTHS